MGLESGEIRSVPAGRQLTKTARSAKLHTLDGPIAQLVEQRTLNPRVVGSSPIRVISFFTPGNSNLSASCGDNNGPDPAPVLFTDSRKQPPFPKQSRQFSRQFLKGRLGLGGAYRARFPGKTFSLLFFLIFYSLNDTRYFLSMREG
jgi:hypothetical protein